MQIDQIGQGISDRRKQLGLSQEELARKIGVTRQAVSRWESGTALPSVDNMVELSRALEVSVDELLRLAPQQKESSLSTQSIGLLLDEHTAQQAKRIKRLTLAIAAAVLILIAGITISTIAGLLRSSRMEALLNDRITATNNSLSSSISSLNARIGATIQQAVSDGNSRLTDSSDRCSYDHDSRSFVITLRAQVQELGEYSDAEFYILSNSSGKRFSAPAEMTDSGFAGSIYIPDEGQDFISGRAYISWQENGETVTEKIPFYDVTTYYMRLEIDWLSLSTSTREGYDLKVNPYTNIYFSYENPDTYPASIRYDIFHDGELLKTLTEPISIRHDQIDKNSLPSKIDHTLPDFIPLEGITSTDGLLLRVTVTDALGREFTKEHLPPH